MIGLRLEINLPPAPQSQRKATPPKATPPKAAAVVIDDSSDEEEIVGITLDSSDSSPAPTPAKSAKRKTPPAQPKKEVGA